MGNEILMFLVSCQIKNREYLALLDNLIDEGYSIYSPDYVEISGKSQELSFFLYLMIYNYGSVEEEGTAVLGLGDLSDYKFEAYRDSLKLRHDIELYPVTAMLSYKPTIINSSSPSVSTGASSLPSGSTPNNILGTNSNNQPVWKTNIIGSSFNTLFG